jgi:hypothetical protein
MFNFFKKVKYKFKRKNIKFNWVYKLKCEFNELSHNNWIFFLYCYFYWYLFLYIWF